MKKHRFGLMIACALLSVCAYALPPAEASPGASPQVSAIATTSMQKTFASKGMAGIVAAVSGCYAKLGGSSPSPAASACIAKDFAGYMIDGRPPGSGVAYFRTANMAARQQAFISHMSHDDALAYLRNAYGTSPGEGWTEKPGWRTSPSA